MEAAGAVRIVNRSSATRGLVYMDMLGDGDSSTQESKSLMGMIPLQESWNALDMCKNEWEADCGSLKNSITWCNYKI